MASGFSSFTADQWKHWTVLYSLACLKSILPICDFKCWLNLVKAAISFVQEVLAFLEQKKLIFLKTFCMEAESLYSAKYLTPNIHFHLHLLECIEDFGPVYSFWLFTFERLNGLLGGYPTNNRSIEVQLMRKFCMLDISVDPSLPKEFSTLLKPASLKGSLSACCKASNAEELMMMPFPPVVESSLNSSMQEVFASLLRSGSLMIKVML